MGVEMVDLIAPRFILMQQTQSYYMLVNHKWRVYMFSNTCVWNNLGYGCAFHCLIEIINDFLKQVNHWIMEARFICWSIPSPNNSWAKRGGHNSSRQAWAFTQNLVIGTFPHSILKSWRNTHNKSVTLTLGWLKQDLKDK